ncbi:MAG: glutamine-synthetase adenylyltransferase [Pseudomonadota bacterium]
MQVHLDAVEGRSHRRVMGFSERITRLPVAFSSELGDEAAARIPDTRDQFRALVRGAAGSAPFLAELMRKEAPWIARLDRTSPEALRDEILASHFTSSDLATELRQAKRRIALLCGLADLGGVWPLETVTQCLSDFADLAVHNGVTTLVSAAISRGILPGLTEEDAAQAGGLCILAMGKHGAGELNYSSDIDLICLFDETRFAPSDYDTARAGFVRITRQLTALLSDNTDQGYVFRTDLRLRPDAAVTPVCIAMEAAERYYESVGRNWERAAFIKARACAGDIAAGQAFLDRLRPFVWRRHLDFATIEDTHDMRLRIRDHKGLHSDNIDGRNIKLAPGGIREIEFFAQTRQLIAGGRDPSLQKRGTVEALSALAGAGWIPSETAETLTLCYRDWREIEHRLQMVADAQTHSLPKKPDDFRRLTNLMGREDPDQLRDEIRNRIDTVSHHAVEFFEPAQPPSEALSEIQTYLAKWRGVPALRSPRSVAIFKRVFPGMLERFRAAKDPDAALVAFERFIAGLPAGVQVFSLFEANPDLVDLFVDVCTASPDLAEYLSRNAKVLDAVIAGEFFTPWPGVAVLKSALDQELAKEEDYEAKLDQARRWKKEWHFRSSVHFLRGLTDSQEASIEYGDIAEAVVMALFDVVTEQFSKKHGVPPGRGAAVLAMGSLGAGQLNTRSDLDLIVIYDPGEAAQSDGLRPLSIRPYFARLTQALITAITAPTAEGKLYDVDMRLRPSGQSGPVATSLAAFDSYQKTEAWVWEHLALTRARALAGAPSLLADIEAVRTDVLSAGAGAAQVFEELGQMRKRLFDARPGRAPWDVKDGPGGVQDIELFVQALALLSGALTRRAPEQIEAATTTKFIDVAQARQLSASLDLLRHVQSATRLLGTAPLSETSLSGSGWQIVLRVAGCESQQHLQDKIEECRNWAAKLINSTLPPLPEEAE